MAYSMRFFLTGIMNAVSVVFFDWHMNDAFSA